MHPVTPEKNVFWKNFGKTKHCIDPIFCTVKFSCHKKVLTLHII